MNDSKTTATSDYGRVKRSVSTSQTTQSLTQRRAWKALVAHYQNVRELHLRKLFADDPTRGERMAAEAVGLYLDYSKNRVTDETLNLLVQLAHESRLRERIGAMFRGDKINVTENRAVLHVALRAPKRTSMIVDGENVCAAGPCGPRQDGRFLQHCARPNEACGQNQNIRYGRNQ